MNTFRPAKETYVEQRKCGQTKTHEDEQVYNSLYSATDGNQDDSRRLAEPRIFSKYDLLQSLSSVQ